MIFAVWSIISVVLWYRLCKRRPLNREQRQLNRRGSQYIGRVYTLEQAVENGRGKVRVGDTLWLAQSDHDIPAGTKVRVTGQEGAALLVEAE